MDLIIVESPTKAKTLGKYLGGKYDVVATYGHIRDLPERKLGVDPAKNFAIDYVQTEKQKQRIDEIKRLSDKAETVYIATDPDREGEAIAWHVKELLSKHEGKGGKGKKETKEEKADGHDGMFKRVTFHEITKTAIEAALTHPGHIDDKLVDAQQARRVVDRLVGYKLSPVLWRKVRRGLSAGRVQSVAVRLVVEREKEIEAFKPEEYWVLDVEAATGNKKETFWVVLALKNGEKLKVDNEKTASEVELDLHTGIYAVKEVKKRDVVKTPPAPFTTSTLQQTAANKLGWSAKKTMQVAQSLYEEGLITYHRTDSTNIAVEAVKMASDYIVATFGADYALKEARVYKTKSKVAQEAHEAIRPTNLSVTPTAGMAVFTNREQERLYELVWKRFLATQMAEARGEAVKVLVSCAVKSGVEYGLEAKGETIHFDGWLKLYAVAAKAKAIQEDEADEVDEAKTEDQRLPELTDGQSLTKQQVKKQQKFTQPPARYNDASLIKALEEMGIGRPSTYAPTLSTIQDRQYVERIENKRLKPTALGQAVNEFLMTNFPEIVDFQFTAKMEDDLDEVANGEKKWKEVAGDFYTPFEKKLESVGETATRVKVEVESTGEKCPKCTEGEVVVRVGKFGKFLSCSRYPECDYTAQYQNKIGVKCPKCKDGDVIMRKTKTGKTFFGCSNYPNCDYASWNKPINEPQNASVPAQPVTV